MCRGLGFSEQDRDENVRRIGFVAELLARHGVVVIVAAISPYRAARDKIRARIDNFIEIHMHCPLGVLIGRDVKGLYRRVLAGEIPCFTGISDPYEPPVAPELVVDSPTEDPRHSLARMHIS